MLEDTRPRRRGDGGASPPASAYPASAAAGAARGRALAEPPPPEAARFFITGGTLPRDATCYVRRRADDELYDSLRAGEYAYVLTARQMGKSSLMVRTAARLREEGGTAVAVVDLSALGQNLSPAQWYLGQLRRIGRQLDLEDEVEDHWDATEERTASGSPLQRWRAALEEVVLARCPGRIVLFIDEIDAVRSLPFPADEYFAALRELYNRRTEDPDLRRLSVCLLGVATPSRLIQDPHTTPFNIGHRIELTDFTPEEAGALAGGLGPRGDALLRRVLHWTAGHPYLTQRLCREVAADAAAPPEAHTEADVDRHCAALFLAPGAREREENLLFVRESLLRTGDDADLAALLDLYGRVLGGRAVRDDGEENQTAAALRLSGVVRRDAAGRLRVRNPIYARVFDAGWVRANLPDAEARRQRAAYRRGLFRAGTVSATVLVAVGSLALLANQSERRAVRAELTIRAERDQTVRLLYASDMSRAQQSLEDENVGRARQVLGLHASVPAERSRFEWRYLWKQANRAERVLPGGDSATRAVWRAADGSAVLAVDAAGVLRRWGASGTEPASAPLTVFTSDPARTGAKDPEPARVAAFSPDGRTLAVGGTGGRIALVETTTGRTRKGWKGHRELIRALTFSPDGKRLVTGGSDGAVGVWDAAGGLQRQAFIPAPGTEEASYAASRVAVSPDGRYLLVGYRFGKFPYRGKLVLWDLKAARPVWAPQESKTFADAVAFSPDGTRIAVADAARTLRIIEVDTGKLRYQKPVEERIQEVAFSPDGKTLATVGNDQAVRLWDAATGDERGSLPGQEKTLRCLAFSPDGAHLLTGGDGGGAQVWKARAPKPMLRRDLSAAAGGASWFSAWLFQGGRRAVVTTDSQASDAYLLDAETGRDPLHVSALSAEPVASTALSRDGATLAIGGNDGALRLWNAITGVVGKTLLTGNATHDTKGKPAPPVAALAFLPNGRHMVSGDGAGRVTLWEVASGRLVQQLTVSAPEPAGAGPSVPPTVDLLDASPDGLVAIGCGQKGQVFLWEPLSRNGKETLRSLPVAKAHTEPLFSLAFSPDGATLATGSEDQSVVVWNVASGIARHRLKGHGGTVRALAFSHDGQTLASAGDDTRVVLWDVAVGRETLMLNHGGSSVWVLSFTDDDTALRLLNSGRYLTEWDARLP